MSALKILINPFKRYSERKILLIGFLFFLGGSWIGQVFNAHFDGVFDLHFSESATISTALIENLIDILCLFILLSIAGKILNHRTRFIDILALTTLSRFPIYLLSLTNINEVSFKAAQKLLPLIQHPGEIPLKPLILTIFFGILAVIGMIWTIALLYNGFKVATHAKKKRLLIGFIIAVLLSEVLSKIIFIKLL